MSKYIRDNQLEQYSNQDTEEFHIKSKKMKKFKDLEDKAHKQNQQNKKR